MKKLYLLAGAFTLFSINAHAYYQNEQYYQDAPRYEQRNTTYTREKPQEVRYVEEGYVRKEAPRYRQVSNAEAQQYNEKKIYKEVDDENAIRPYIGVDLVGSNLNAGGDEEDEQYFKRYFDKKLTSFSGVAGMRINKNFGFEAFYQQAFKGKKKYTDDVFRGKSSVQFKDYGLDLIGYMPITTEMDLLASLGMANYDFKISDKYKDKFIGMFHGEDSFDFDTLGVRLGLGVQFNLTDTLSIRAMARYIHMDKDEYIRSMTEFSLGLRYMF